MHKRPELEIAALMAARDYSIGSMLFRNTLSRKLSLNLTESLCLTMLAIKGNSTPTQLAHFTGLTTGAATAMLDRLEKRGYIRRKPNPADRRGLIIEIDVRYAELSQELVVGIQKAHRELIGRFSDHELEIVRDFLQGFTENMRIHARIIDEDSPWL